MQQISSIMYEMICIMHLLHQLCQLAYNVYQPAYNATSNVSTNASQLCKAQINHNSRPHTMNYKAKCNLLHTCSLGGLGFEWPSSFCHCGSVVRRTKFQIGYDFQYTILERWCSGRKTKKKPLQFVNKLPQHICPR